jgi:hypothetical protein
MEEEWRSVREANGLLEVSNLGRVRSVDRELIVAGRTRLGTMQGNFRARQPGKMLALCEDRRCGYLEVAQMAGGKRRKYRVHRLVAQAFVPGYFEGASVDHKDGNKLNNRADNLEWVTLSENTRRQWASGLVDLRGAAHPGSKLTKEQAAAIKLLAENGFPAALVGAWFGVQRDTVYAIKAGHRWRNTLKENGHVDR